MTIDDEKFSRFLDHEARAYNAPPADVPRDAMWAAIQARRHAGAPRRRVPVLWMGLAATLLLGVGIGRYSARKGGAEGAPAALAGLPTVPDSGAGIAYRLAARDHLARAEALLTAYRSADPGQSGAEDAARITDWAKEVLQNTRLLLDSPAAADPARAQLLRDLEVVLVQMIQRSPAASGADESRAQVDRSIERTQVLTRLRSARPVALNGAD